MPPPLDPQLRDRVRLLIGSFSADPTDPRVFAQLEEHLFLSGAWNELAEVYECRITALDAHSPEWSELLLRMGEVLDERLHAPRAAMRRYRELLSRNPRHTEALARLRRIHARLGETAAALQIAELEETLDLPDAARARTLAEAGELWRELGEPEEARRRFYAAMRLDPACDGALAGLAALALDQGDRDRAQALHERRIDVLAGSSRLDAMEQLAELIADAHPERSRALLRDVVAEDPERHRALEKLGAIETADGATERADSIRAQLWRLVDEPADRAKVALEAATARLEGDGDIRATLAWIDRARRDAPDDPGVHRLRVRVLRRAGRAAELADALEDLNRTAGPTAMRQLEIAVLHERDGRPRRAVEFLTALLDRDPADREALAVLDRCLSRLGRHPDRVDVLERRIQLAEGEEERADLCIDLGDALSHHVGEDEAALELYRKALAHAPHHVAGIERLRQLLRKLDRCDELETLLAERGRSSPDPKTGAGFWVELGKLRLERGAAPEAAREAFHQALGRDPDYLPAVHALRQVQREDAVADQAPAARLRERIEGARRDGDLEGARLAAEELVALEPGPEPFRALAGVARELGDPDAERRALESQIRIEPPSPSKAGGHSRLAELELERGDAAAPERAARHLRHAIELDPTPQLRARLVDLYRRTGDLDALVTELRAQLAAGPDDDAVRRDLAQALAERGDRAGAIEVLRPAFDAAPGRADLADLLESLLADEDRIEELCDALGARLARERDPARRRELAYRRAGLLLDGLDRPRDAAAALRELADPSRRAPLEDIYERALEAADDGRELEAWLGTREELADAPDRVPLAVRRAELQRRAGRPAEAIATLEGARATASGEGLETVLRVLLPLLRDSGDLRGETEALGQLAASCTDPAARTQLRLERARRLLEPGGDADTALRELRALESEPHSGPAELEQLADLLGRAGAHADQLRALERVVAITEAGAARAGALRSIAALCESGPEPVRDPDRVESALREVLALEPGDGASFDALAGQLEARGRLVELEALLRQRLDSGAAGEPGRCAAAVRLAELLIERGQPRDAAVLLAQARERGGTPRVDELLYRAFEACDDADSRIRLCAERAGDPSAPDRVTWLERWLEGLEATGAPPEELLPVVELLVEARPDRPELETRLLALLRGLDRHDDLALRIERSLESGRLSGRACAERALELLSLYEGPLASPERALAWVEEHAGDDRELRLRGAALASRAGAHDREVALLEPLAGEAGDLEVARSYALALAALGRDGEAESRLRVLHRQRPRDRQVLEALETTLRRRGALAELAELLESHFALEPSEGRARLAREGLRLAETAGDDAAVLRWIRRWQAVEGLPATQLQRWVELERMHGQRRDRLLALAALRSGLDDPDARARVCAEEAELHLGAGALELARQRYAQALELTHRPPDEWLAALSEILERQGRSAERAEVVGRRIGLGRTSPEERLQLRELRANLLLESPDTRAEGARELRELVDEAGDADPAATVRRLRSLLDFDDQPDCTPSWCDTAERLVPLLGDHESVELTRELARRLAVVVCDRGRAIRWWEQVLERQPGDLEALRALIELVDQPGGEARRAELLEQLAASASESDPRPWVEAAALRWESLRDAPGAIADLERADRTGAVTDALRQRVLILRSELWRHVGRADDERETLEALIETCGERPDSAPHWMRLAALEAGRDGRSDAAERAVWHALERAEDEGAIRADARRVLESVASWESAVQLLRTEIGASGEEDRAPLLRHLARLEWDELGRADEASAVLEELAQVADLDPDDCERWARALESQGEWPAAVQRRRQALLALGERASPEDWLELARAAIERADDTDAAREACEAALTAGADATVRARALELRGRLVDRAADPITAIEDLVAIAEAHGDQVESAASLVRAGDLARDQLGDETRAWALYRRALKCDASCVRALQGAGRVALERGEWSEAERMFGIAVPLLEAEGSRAEAGAAALCAAQAALEQRRDAEAFRYLDQSLEATPSSSDALDAMASLSLRLGDWTRAKQCIEARLRLQELDPLDQAERWVRLAQAHEGLDDPGEAAVALERAIELRPDDEVSRARHVDLLCRLGERERAVAALESWIGRAPPESCAGLTLRAARLELELERRAEARERLTRLVEAWPDCIDAWIELLELASGDGGPEAVLQAADRIPVDSAAPEQRGAVHWRRARALSDLGRVEEAARLALDTIEADASNVEAARLLSANLGRIEDWQRAVTQLEATLDRGGLPPMVEAELWEAVGRAYAGPLESIEQAERCYRRALDSNPLRATAREALADVTAFDPAAHAESVHLHRELLEAFPARPQSWRSIARIAQHWQREPASATCELVLDAVRANGGAEVRTDLGPLVDASEPDDAVVRAACELLRALEEAGGLPKPNGSQPPVPDALRAELLGLTGAAWEVDDSSLRSLWSRPVEDALLNGDRLSRRSRRRLNRALRGPSRGLLRELEVATWRTEMLAQAAARALGSRRIKLAELLHVMLEVWPKTSSLDLRSGGKLAEALQLCPPAQQLLLRIADPTLRSLGL